MAPHRTHITMLTKPQTPDAEQLRLLNMLQIFDSVFPIGAFTLSNGLETMVTAGRVTTPEALSRYCNDFLRILPYNDLGGAALACTLADRDEAICQLDAYLSASRGPSELRSGTIRLCQRLIRVEERIQTTPFLTRYQKLIGQKQARGNHGIAVGLLIRDLQLEPETALCTYVYNQMSSMVTNAVKLIPLSQLDGQCVLNQLFPAIKSAVTLAMQITPEDIGIGGTAFDLCSMEHETLYTRIYIS